MLIYFGCKFNEGNYILCTVPLSTIELLIVLTLTVCVSSDLFWDFHVDYIIKEVVLNVYFVLGPLCMASGLNIKAL
jgi:hypothetical protein